MTGWLTDPKLPLGFNSEEALKKYMRRFTPDELAAILDKIIAKVPRYRSRSDLVRQVLWDFADSFTNEE